MDCVCVYEEGAVTVDGRIKITPKDFDDRAWLQDIDYACYRANLARKYARNVYSNYYDNIRMVDKITYNTLKKDWKLEENVVYIVTEY